MGNEISYNDNNPSTVQRFSSAPTPDEYNHNTYHHSKKSTLIKPPNHPSIPTVEYSQSRSTSKSKSKTKSKSKSKPKSAKNKTRKQSRSTTTPKGLPNFTPTLSYHLSLPDIPTEIQQNNSFSHSCQSYSIGSPTSNNHNFVYVGRQSQLVDLSKVENGITNRYINSRVVKIAAEFWEEHIASKSLCDKLVCYINILKYHMLMFIEVNANRMK